MLRIGEPKINIKHSKLNQPPTESYFLTSIPSISYFFFFFLFFAVLRLTVAQRVCVWLVADFEALNFRFNTWVTKC